MTARYRYKPFESCRGVNEQVSSRCGDARAGGCGKVARLAACLTHIECRIVDTLEMGDQAVGKS
ncbi:MAG: hypothetical protein ACXV39_12635, partial [Halobacteriota archaeon]